MPKNRKFMPSSRIELWNFHAHFRVVLLCRLLVDIFGKDNDANVQAELPSIEKIVVLLWLFRNESSVLSYITDLVETVRIFCV